MSEFLAMGGYAQFVWPSYAVAVLALLWNVFASRRAHREARAQLQRQIAVESRRGSQS